MSVTASELVAQAQAHIENLSPEDVAGEQTATLVDVREPAELRKTGVIRGAISAPRGMLEFYADPGSPYHMEGFDPGARLIVVCGSGARSALATVSLKQLGYTNVAHLKGGMAAWQALGYPTVPFEGGTQ